MLDVVYARKPDGEDVEEVGFVRREGLAGEDLEEVAEVVAAGIVSGRGTGRGAGGGREGRAPGGIRRNAVRGGEYRRMG